jgi:hypothetical protein
MNRQSAHQPGQAIGDARGSDRLLRRARLHSPASSHANLRGELEQRACGLGEIVVERRSVGHDSHRHIEMPCVDQIGKALARQATLPNRTSEGIGHRVTRRFGGASLVERIAPPLQSDLAKLRLTQSLADAGELDIEGVEGKQGLAAGAGREQRARIAVRISIADDAPDPVLSFAFLQGLPDLKA